MKIMEDLTLKKLLLAGIGSMAYTYEKGEEIVEDLIKKGEITISQGKELNQELKRKNMGEKAPDHEGAVWEMLRDVLSGMDIATKEDLNRLEERIKRLEDR